MKKLLITIFTIFLTFLSVNAEDESVILPSQTGVVESVEYIDFGNGENVQTKQTAKIRLLSGELKGNIIFADNMLTGNPYYDINLKKGAKVILHVEEDDEGLIYSVEDMKRSGVLLWLSVLFCALLIAIGKRKGLCSLISILLTCLLIYFGLSPLILAGMNPIFATIFICLLSTAVTMYLVGGFNRKSTSAIIGCTLSLITAGMLSFITVKCAHLTGFANENCTFLFSAHPELNFVSITVGMMILAALGAVMDVGMSIASTINEIYKVDNSKTVKELFVSGMNVGRDIIGTMANTLILVYMGSALPLLLLASNIDFVKFINLNQVVTEVASALIGSAGIVVCVPLTALVASELIKKHSQKIDFSEFEDKIA